MIGKIFNNRYEIKEKLGSGGTALVYMGRDTLLGRLVTVKILREEYANDQQFVARFRREAQSVASLSHNNIVSVYDVGYEDTYHYIVMEYVEGPNLKEYIKEHGPLPVEKAVDITIQILNALEHAHHHGVIHRDIKSHNILFGKEGVVKVTDFGIAMAIGEMHQNYVDSQGNVIGSVQYMSPEQVQGLPVSEKIGYLFFGHRAVRNADGAFALYGQHPLGSSHAACAGGGFAAAPLEQRCPHGLIVCGAAGHAQKSGYPLRFRL